LMHFPSTGPITGPGGAARLPKPVADDAAGFRL
jgi:hypothetical protein